MDLLESVKLDLRKSSVTYLDSSIAEDIEAALEIIRTAGIKPDESDPLVVRAVKHYLRYLHDFNGEADRYKASFDELVKTMSFSSERRLDVSEE